MYGFVRELSHSQSFPPNGFIPKTFRSKIDFFRYNQLPPIKEEEGNVGQNDIESRNFSLFSQTSSGRIDRSSSYGENERRRLIGEEWVKSEISASIPPLVNINCLMNVDMKQKSVWKTSFGKRLINGKAAVAETVSLPVIKKPKEEDEKLKENQSSNSVNFTESLSNNRNIQIVLGNGIAQAKEKKTKPVKVPKKLRKTQARKKSNKQSPSETCPDGKMEPYQAESSVRTDPPSSESLTNSTLMSTKTRNQNYLSRCVQNILGVVTANYTCKYCDETFPKEEELDSHQDKHEREKETCILCSKVFYNFKEFTEHLMNHESVDEFSCKKCRKYFPSLKKYKAHYKNVHLKSLDLDSEITCNMEPTKEQSLKYLCKRCQLELDSEENLRDHRRRHIRSDLMGAYLLSNKTMLNYEA